MNRTEQPQLNNTQLSKKLSWLLRHGAVEKHLAIQSNGYVSIEAILQHKEYAPHFTIEVLQSIVALDKKRRYSLRPNPITGLYEIRANQGHSLDSVKAEECLERVMHAADVPLAVHGTYYSNWRQIRTEGLRPMSRTHVHFATCSTGGGSISGFRNNCELLIYLDVEKAMMQGGMEIYRSANDVILCAGKNGVISKEYFAKVIDRRSGKFVEY